MFQESPIPTFNWRRLDGTWLLDEYNPVAERFTAGRFAAFLGRPAEEIYPDLPQFAEFLRRCAAGRVAITWELRYPMRSTGERRDLILSFVAVTPDLVMVHAQDITERKQAADALARQYRAAEAARAEARAILDATEEGIILVASDGRCLSANRRVAELLGLDRQELIGRPVGEFDALLDRALDLTNHREMLAACQRDPERITRLELRQHWPVQRDLTLYSTPVHAAAGELLGRLFAFRDVTRERSADRLKDEFISMVSHELHTPLTAIKGYVGILLADTTDPLSAEQREFLSIIEDSTDREVTLVNDLLDISRLEAGHVNLHPRPLDLASLLRQVAATLRPQCRAKSQQLIVDVAPELPSVMGDATRLTQVFTNLLVNAHKYTPAGGRLTITAGATEDALRVDIQDTGVGISPEEQGRLFTRFYRANNPLTQDVSGTGLGLVITRALVERHGGQIAVASSPGQGSTFSVILPRLVAALEPSGSRRR
jgi:PAS domain S-box-containing protein